MVYPLAFDLCFPALSKPLDITRRRIPICSCKAVCLTSFLRFDTFTKTGMGRRAELGRSEHVGYVMWNLFDQTFWEREGYDVGQVSGRGGESGSVASWVPGILCIGFGGGSVYECERMAVMNEMECVRDYGYQCYNACELETRA